MNNIKLERIIQRHCIPSAKKYCSKPIVRLHLYYFIGSREGVLKADNVKYLYKKTHHDQNWQTIDKQHLRPLIERGLIAWKESSSPEKNCRELILTESGRLIWEKMQCKCVREVLSEVLDVKIGIEE